MSVHPSAVIAPGAVVPASCTIGPFCTIGPQVTLGENCELISHVVIDGHTTLGDGCKIYSFTALGVPPQDLKYAGESTRTTIGDRTVIHQCVTVSRGTTGGGGHTSIGSDCLLMAYSHVGHDSHIGNHCILANNATLAGHVTVHDHAVVGAFSPVHQHCHVGPYAYIGGGSIITRDVLPYSITSAERDNKAYGINKIGLERKGFTREELVQLRNAFRLLSASKLNTTQALEAIREKIASGEFGPRVQVLVDFVVNSHRGVIK